MQSSVARPYDTIRESKEFHITDLLKQSTISNRGNQERPPVAWQLQHQTSKLAKDIQDVLSAQDSYQMIQTETDFDVQKKDDGYYDLKVDEEFVIKNYRLIKKKKEGTFGVP